MLDEMTFRHPFQLIPFNDVTVVKNRQLNYHLAIPIASSDQQALGDSEVSRF